MGVTVTRRPTVRCQTFGVGSGVTVPRSDVKQHGMGQVEGSWGPVWGRATHPYLSVVVMVRHALPSQAQ